MTFKQKLLFIVEMSTDIEYFKTLWLLYVKTKFDTRIERSAPSALCFVWISVQIAHIYLCSLNLLVFITDVKLIYSAVRVESINTGLVISP